MNPLYSHQRRMMHNEKNGLASTAKRTFWNKTILCILTKSLMNMLGLTKKALRLGQIPPSTQHVVMWETQCHSRHAQNHLNGCDWNSPRMVSLWLAAIAEKTHWWMLCLVYTFGYHQKTLKLLKRLPSWLTKYRLMIGFIWDDGDYISIANGLLGIHSTLGNLTFCDGLNSLKHAQKWLN